MNVMRKTRNLCYLAQFLLATVATPLLGANELKLDFFSYNYADQREALGTPNPNHIVKLDRNNGVIAQLKGREKKLVHLNLGSMLRGDFVCSIDFVIPRSQKGITNELMVRQFGFKTTDGKDVTFNKFPKGRPRDQRLSLFVTRSGGNIRIVMQGKQVSQSKLNGTGGLFFCLLAPAKIHIHSYRIQGEEAPAVAGVLKPKNQYRPPGKTLAGVFRNSFSKLNLTAGRPKANSFAKSPQPGVRASRGAGGALAGGKGGGRLGGLGSGSLGAGGLGAPRGTAGNGQPNASGNALKVGSLKPKAPDLGATLKHKEWTISGLNGRQNQDNLEDAVRIRGDVGLRIIKKERLAIVAMHDKELTGDFHCVVRVSVASQRESSKRKQYGNILVGLPNLTNNGYQFPSGRYARLKPQRTRKSYYVHIVRKGKDIKVEASNRATLKKKSKRKGRTQPKISRQKKAAQFGGGQFNRFAPKQDGPMRLGVAANQDIRFWVRSIKFLPVKKKGIR